MDESNAIVCAQCERKIVSAHQNTNRIMSLTSICGNCHRPICPKCFHGEFLCQTCLSTVPTQKYQVLKSVINDWEKKFIDLHWEKYGLFRRIVPVFLWFFIFMWIANEPIENAHLGIVIYMIFITIAYVPLTILLLQIPTQTFKIEIIRMVGSLLFKKMVEAPSLETSMAKLPPIPKKDYLQNMKWEAFIGSIDPLAYFLQQGGGM